MIQKVHQYIDFLFGQRGRRLVKYKNLNVLSKRLCNLHHLLHANAEMLRFCMKVCADT